MTPRSLRRAAERQAAKQARKQANQLTALNPATAAEPTPLNAEPRPIEPPPARTISEAQLTANRANALLSHGPSSPEGKAISSRNHTQHGLTSQPTGQPLMLAGESQAEYDRTAAAFAAEWNAATATERDLVERLTNAAWLRNRAARLQDQLLLSLEGKSPTPQDLKQFELYGRYYSMHVRMFNKAFADLLRLRTFNYRQKKETAQLERRTEESRVKNQIRFESQKQKSEAHALKMETLRLKQQAIKQRNQRPPKLQPPFQSPQAAAV